MNSDLARLQPYPFERLASLTAGVTPPSSVSPIALTIGEPKHTPPAFALEALSGALSGVGQYPSTAGLTALREACAGWLARRYRLPEDAIDPGGASGGGQVLPVNGTREALFAFAQAIVDPRRGTSAGARALVAMPNPFYQIYEGAALLAGADPYYIDTPARTGFLPDVGSVPAAVWERVQLLYVCSPGNPAGAVLEESHWREIIALADRYDFVIAADECYADIYADEHRPPPSLLQAAWNGGRRDFARCVVFHSLSKRSSLPGLRSGFVAGDRRLLGEFLRYRTYHGCAMPLPVQRASIAAWSDDAHARINRELYREKFARVLPILAPHLALDVPQGGFYLWPEIGDDDERFTRELLAATHVAVLPGSYLARDAGAGNPGRGRVRISLVASVDECVEAARRIVDFLAVRSRSG